MIQWREQRIELPLRPLEDLYRRLSAVDAQLVQARCCDGCVIAVGGVTRSAVEEHLAASRNEQGGLLVGEVFTGEDGVIAAVHVRAGIAATDFCSSGIALRMEAAVWTRAREALGAREMIVGWYHSHPGLGAFFSDTDRTTQRAFFPHPFSLGWVRDPVYGEERWFLGAQSDEVPAMRVLALEPNAGCEA